MGRFKHEGAVTGQATLLDIKAQGRLQDCEHIRVPLPDGHLLHLGILKESNAAVASRLPCTTWSMTSSTPMFDPITRILIRQGETPQLENINIVQTFFTRGEATEAAHRFMDELDARVGKCVRHEQWEVDGLVSILVLPQAGGAERAHLVVIESDDGINRRFMPLPEAIAQEYNRGKQAS